MTDGRFDVYRNVFALIVEIDDYEGETHLQTKRAVDYILEHFISPTSGMNLIDIIQQYFSFHYPFRLHIPICQSVPTKVIPYIHLRKTIRLLLQRLTASGAKWELFLFKGQRYTAAKKALL